MHNPTTSATLLLSQIRDKVEACFGYRPCLWQIRVVQALLKNDKDVVSIAATGSGKTLTFWMPLLFVPEAIQIVITPLNILGKQNVETLAKVGIKAISITAESATVENFRAIANGEYRAIVTNIETVSKPSGGFEKLWLDKDFGPKILNVVWDEGQCIGKWGEFRPEYKDAGNLRHIMPKTIRFFVTSATLPPRVLNDVMQILAMREENTYIFYRSNDRPNVHITVRKMKYPLNSYMDLAFLIQDDWDGVSPLPYKFVIFFDNIADSIAAAHYLRSRMPLHQRHKVKWFNSEMSVEFRDEESAKFKAGEDEGLACTESFGMGIDLPNITLIIQWRASCDLCTLWQRFGRAARDFALTAIALFLVEPMYFDETKDEKAARKAKREEKAKQKAREKVQAGESERGQLGKRKRTDGVGEDSQTRSPRRTAQSWLPIIDPSHPSAAESSTASAATLHAQFVAASFMTPAHNQPVIPRTVLGPLVSSGMQSDDEISEDDDARDTAVRLVERQTVYNGLCSSKTEKFGGKRKSRKKDGNELEPAMDDTINAGSPGHYFKCFRAPGNLYFNNDAAVSDHMDCQPGMPEGCPRCSFKQPLVCCELCSPEFFKDFARVNLDKKKAAPPRSRIKDHVASAAELSLRNALHTFRRNTTITKFGRATLMDMGPGVIMSDAVLRRIVDCTHDHKIDSLASLSKETRWLNAQAYSDEVIMLINKHCPKPAPPPLLVSTPLQSMQLPASAALPLENSASSTTQKTRKCGKCGSTSHIASNKICRFHPHHNAAPGRSTDSENINISNSTTQAPTHRASTTYQSILRF
ncbi:P-loop containing nucleoside triphosphate hydrolase protein [Crassisporium funariophilum]|nr:P-loop containing nucleoside triphosphate hydrolase protein [Crassisporium funariophilum]